MAASDSDSAIPDTHKSENESDFTSDSDIRSENESGSNAPHDTSMQDDPDSASSAASPEDPMPTESNDSSNNEGAELVNAYEGPRALIVAHLGVVFISHLQNTTTPLAPYPTRIDREPGNSLARSVAPIHGYLKWQINAIEELFGNPPRMPRVRERSLSACCSYCIGSAIWPRPGHQWTTLHCRGRTRPTAGKSPCGKIFS